MNLNNAADHSIYQGGESRLWVPTNIMSENEPEQLEMLDGLTGMNAELGLQLQPGGELSYLVADCTRRLLELQVRSLATRGMIDDLGIPVLTDRYPRYKAKLEANLGHAYGVMACDNRIVDEVPYRLEASRLFGLAQARFEALGSRIDLGELKLREGAVGYTRAAKDFSQENGTWKRHAGQAEEHFTNAVKYLGGAAEPIADYAYYGLCLVRALKGDMDILDNTVNALEKRLQGTSKLNRNSNIISALSNLAKTRKDTKGGFTPKTPEFIVWKARELVRSYSEGMLAEKPQAQRKSSSRIVT